MSGGPHGSPKSHRKCNKNGKRTRDISTQCGKWLALKKAIDKNATFRAEVLEYIDNIITILGYPKPKNLSPEDERIRIESREALSNHHIADLALKVQPLNTCRWNL